MISDPGESLLPHQRTLAPCLLLEAFDRGDIDERCLSHLLALRVLDLLEAGLLRLWS